MALFLAVLMGMAALAIDLGMLQKVRAEAQRAADAAALAGASAFAVGEDYGVQGDSALARARKLAGENVMGGKPVDTAEGCADSPAIPVDNDGTPPDDPRQPDRTAGTCEAAIAVWYPTAGNPGLPAKVRVLIRRAAVPVWFAKIFGFKSFPIAAKAAAIATGAGASKCVLPLVFPDYWDENNTDTNDPANNNWPDDKQGKLKAEDWAWDDVPATPDCYWRLGDSEAQADGGSVACAAARTGDSKKYGTGLGTNLRNNLETNGRKYVQDVGRPFVIKPSGGGSPFAPSFYNLWDMPGGSSGGADVKDRIIDPCKGGQVISLGVTYNSKPGATIGPVDQAFKERLNRPDPTGAKWDIGADTLTYNKGTNWHDSPKVILVPLAHPKYIANGQTEVQFNNFVFFFIESVDKDVTVRFIGPATGGLGGPTSGSLLKTIRLVE
jgi:hypothetical protein